MFDFLPQTPLVDAEFSAIKSQIGKQVASLIARRSAPNTLHHYTDAAGLKGIIESGTIRATHIAYMNDASEYLHAVGLLLDHMRIAKKARTDKDQLALLEAMDAPVANTKPEHAHLILSRVSRKRKIASINGGHMAAAKVAIRSDSTAGRLPPRLQNTTPF